MKKEKKNTQKTNEANQFREKEGESGAVVVGSANTEYVTKQRKLKTKIEQNPFHTKAKKRKIMHAFCK